MTPHAETAARFLLQEDCLYVVVRRYSWDKDDYIGAYYTRPPAEAHRDRLNGGPYDPDDVQDYQVWRIPVPPVSMA